MYLWGDRQESRALLKREQELRKERIAQRSTEVESDYQQVIEQMERAHQDAIVANERYRKVLQFIDTTCNLIQVCRLRSLIL